MSKTPYYLIRVSKMELREMFATGNYVALIKRGDLTARAIRESHPAPARANEPVCTRSQIIAYINREGKKVVIAHRYLRPDGTLGASGQPDPKTILIDNTLYTVQGPGE